MKEVTIMKDVIIILDFIAYACFAGAAALENIWYIVPSICCGASAIFNMLARKKK